MMKEKEGAQSVVTELEDEVEASQDQEEKASVIVEMFLDEALRDCLTRIKENGPPVMTKASAAIIDISEDDSIIDEEEEVFEETVEETVDHSVDLVIEEMISSVIEQDPEVVCQELVESILTGVVKEIEKKGKKILSNIRYSCSDIRYRKTSTKSQENSDKSGLSLFLYCQESTQKESTQKISKFLKEIQTQKKTYLIAKHSVPRDLVRVDLLFSSSKERSNFVQDVTRRSEDVRGLFLHSLVSTEKELCLMEKPILTEDEIMWIYSESQSLNLFASKEFKVTIEEDVTGVVKFVFENKNIQLSTFLFCVLDRQRALIGRVRKEANIHLPLRMKSQEKGGRVFYPVKIAGAAAEDIKKQEARFGFKIYRTNSKTGLTDIDFENTVMFYRFWTSSFSHRLKKVKFSQVTALSD